eukprot:CAMPEP_0117740160 /NCGR_PEP_ID=MMETSP0947-20121206/4183_1 /TAXON_ID=44440 /ORGANISM="Chattonella subsalsa, Strain CCMP2191" /LENGTH=320 /DNA_ID=CAMNT_0005556235 /DNA_START=190 /DNA_END=1149 /DNA_ORIENTATION=-
MYLITYNKAFHQRKLASVASSGNAAGFILIFLIGIYFYVYTKENDEPILLDAEVQLINARNEIRLLKNQLDSYFLEEKDKENTLLEVQENLMRQLNSLKVKLEMVSEQKQVVLKEKHSIDSADTSIPREAMCMLERLRISNEQISRMKFGSDRARVVFETPKGNLVLETAPYHVMPHATNWFLSLVDAGFWDTCGIIRNAAHVLQANCAGRTKQVATTRRSSIVYQEYNPEFVHYKYTFGIAGRPGGPDFYINLKDNLRAHGPGGQGGTDADPCFAKLIEGQEIIEELHRELPDGFLDKKDFFQFSKVRILQPDEWILYE